MKKQELAKDIVHYIFDPKPNKRFATSVTALFNGSKVTLIDTAYEFQFQELLDEFSKDNIEVEQVIITHFHDDHMEGLKLLRAIPVYGSKRFQESLDLWTDKEEHVHFTPSVTVDMPQSLNYGEHNITMIPHPGHSACGMIIKINDAFLHVSDEIMFAIDGEPLLPSLTDGTQDAKPHLDSINRLRGYEKFTIIPSHGPVFDGETLACEIKNRYSYLAALYDSGGTISFEDTIKNCTCTFAHPEWHQYNCIS